MSKSRKVKIILTTILGLSVTGAVAGTAYVLLKDESLKTEINKLIHEIDDYTNENLGIENKRELKNEATLLIEKLNKAKIGGKISDLKTALQDGRHNFEILKEKNRYGDLAKEVKEYLDSINDEKTKDIFNHLNEQLNTSNTNVINAKTVAEIENEINVLSNKLQEAKNEVANNEAGNRSALVDQFKKMVNDIKEEISNWNDPKYNDIKNSLNTEIEKGLQTVSNPSLTSAEIQAQLEALKKTFDNTKVKKDIIDAKSDFANLVGIINKEISKWDDPKYADIKEELENFINSKTEEVNNETSSAEVIRNIIKELETKFDEAKNNKEEIDTLSEAEIHKRLVAELKKLASDIKLDANQWVSPKFDDIKNPLISSADAKLAIADLESTTSKELSDAIKNLKQEYQNALNAKKQIELNDAKKEFNDLKDSINKEISKWTDEKYNDLKTNLENSILTKNNAVVAENDSIETIMSIVSGLKAEYLDALSAKGIIDAKSEFNKVLEKANILKDDPKLENYIVIKHYLENQINLTTNSVETTPTVENINNQKSILENAIEKTNKDYEIAKAGDEYISVFNKAQLLHSKLENNSAEKIKLDQVMVETKNAVEANDRTKESIEAAKIKLEKVISEIEKITANNALMEFADALNKLKTYQKSLATWNNNAAQPLTTHISDYDAKSKAPNISNELLKQYTKEINKLISDTINNVLTSTINEARSYSKSAPVVEYPSIQNKLENKLAEYNNTSSWTETNKDTKSLELHNYVETIKNEIKEKAYSTFKVLKSNASVYISADYTDPTTVSKINELKSLLSSYDSYNEHTDESKLVVANKELEKRLNEIDLYSEHDKFVKLVENVDKFTKQSTNASALKDKLNVLLPSIKEKENQAFLKKEQLGIRTQYEALKKAYDFSNSFNEYYDLQNSLAHLETKYPQYAKEKFFTDAKTVATTLKAEERNTIDNFDIQKGNTSINTLKAQVNTVLTSIMEKERERNVSLSADASLASTNMLENPFLFKELETYNTDIKPLINYNANSNDLQQGRYEKIIDEFKGKNDLLNEKIRNIKNRNNDILSKFASEDMKDWNNQVIKETELTLNELNSRAQILSDGVTDNLARRVIKAEFKKLFEKVTNKFGEYKNKWNSNKNNIAYSLAVQTYAKTVEELYIYFMSTADVNWVNHRGTGQASTWQKLARKYYGSQYGVNWRGLFTNETAERIIPKISNYKNRFNNSVISAITDSLPSKWAQDSSRALNIVLTQDGYIPIVTNTLQYVDKFVEILNNLSKITKETTTSISNNSERNQVLNYLNGKLQSIYNNFTRNIDKYTVQSKSDLQQEFYAMKLKINDWLSNYKKTSSNQNIRHEGATLYLEGRLKDYEDVITTSGVFADQVVALRSLYNAFENAKRIADRNTSGVVVNEHKSFLKAENTNLLFEFYEALMKMQDKYHFSFKTVSINWLPVYKADTIMDTNWYNEKTSDERIVNSNFIYYDEFEYNWKKKYNVLKSRVDFGLTFNMFPSYATESITTTIYLANYAYQLGRYEKAYNKLKTEMNKYDGTLGDPK